MLNQLEEIITKMTPQQIKSYFLHILNELGNENPDLNIQVNKTIKNKYGSFKVAAYITSHSNNQAIKTVISCKRFKNKISRTDIQLFNNIMEKTNSKKGIFISTTSYAKSAMIYARNHNIALLQIVDGYISSIDCYGKPVSLYNDIPDFVSVIYDLKHYCPIDFIDAYNMTPLNNFILSDINT